MGSACSSLMRKVPGRNTSGLGKRQQKPAGDPEQPEIHDHLNPPSIKGRGPQISRCKLDSAWGPLTGLVGLLLQPVGVRVFRPSSASHLTRTVTRYGLLVAPLLEQGCLGHPAAVFDVAQTTQARTAIAGPARRIHKLPRRISTASHPNESDADWDAAILWQCLFRRSSNRLALLHELRGNAFRRSNLRPIRILQSDRDSVPFRFTQLRHRGMLFHIHVPLTVFSVFIGNLSDLYHKSPVGL